MNRTALREALAQEGLVKTALVHLTPPIKKRLNGGSVATRKGIADLLAQASGEDILQVEQPRSSPTWNPYKSLHDLRLGQAKTISGIDYRAIELILLGLGWERQPYTAMGPPNRVWRLNHEEDLVYGGVGVIRVSPNQYKVINDLRLRSSFRAFDWLADEKTYGVLDEDET